MLVFHTWQVARDLKTAFPPDQLPRVFARTLTQELVTKDDLKTEMALLKVEMVRWVVGAIAFNLLGTASLVFSLVKSVPH